MDDKARGRVVLGGILIVLGIGLFLLQFFEGFGEAFYLFLIGGAFTAWYLYSRAYGLLIPGCILLGLGLGTVGEDAFMSFRGLEEIGLGVGFVALWVIPLIYEGKSIWWPLIPGVILIIVGLSEGNEAFERLFEVGWPLIIVFIGLSLLAGAFGLIGRKHSDETAHTDEPV
jgi:hypothetical protein